MDKSTFSCIKCNPAGWEFEKLGGQCLKCGLHIEKNKDTNERIWVVIYGNLDLSWNMKKIRLPENLEVHGDLNLTGCKNINLDDRSSLKVHGNMFIYDEDIFTRLLKKDFSIEGNTIYENITLTRAEIKNKKFIQEMEGKLPEIKGLFE
jgi:hypothetical protein